MTTLQECKRCNGTDSALTFRCWSCGAVQHVHSLAWAEAKAGEMMGGVCPGCNVSNALLKPNGTPLKGRKFVARALQPEMVLG